MTPHAGHFFAHFLRAYPWRSATMVALLILSGLAEGVGVVTLVPLLEFAGGEGAANEGIGAAVTGVLAKVGLAPDLVVLLSIIVLAILLKAALLWLAMRQVGYTVARVTRDLRLRLIRSLIHARWSYFGAQRTGSFANAVSSEAIRAASAYREACSFLAGVFQILVYVAVAAAISWRVMLLALLAGGTLAFLLKGFVAMSRAAGTAQTTLTKSLTGRLVDVLQGIKPIKAMAREDLVLPLLEHETEGLNEAHRRQVLASESRKFFQEPVITAMIAAALFVLLEIGEQPLSAVLVLAFVFYRLMQHMNTLQMQLQVMAVGESAFWSLKEEIDRAETVQEDLDCGSQVSGVRGEIRFDRVSFSYDGNAPVLRGLDLVIPAGSFVAISGESGSGKTTLADLVLGLHRPDSGEILVGGRPLSTLSLKAWRQQIGYVPQELLLFNDSILRNVTLGDERFDRADVERALRQAGAWEFVSMRPEGMDATVGEKGGMMSGGQRQRIAIARALVHRPSLLILDEVTTALDPATEAEICETLRTLAGDVTVLSISHQPAMRRVADVAYQIRAGVLFEMPGEEAVAVAGS